MNETYEIPGMLSNLQGAYDTAHWETVVLELTPDKGILTRGTVLSMGGTGKLDATTAGNEAQAFGVLLDPSNRHVSSFHRWHGHRLGGKGWQL